MNCRSRILTLIVYKESVNVENLCQKLNTFCDYVYICHDKDKNEDNTLKKEHYHFILKFKNAKWISSVSKELEIADNYFQPVRNLKNAMQYLVHFNDSEKFQYSTNELHGNLKTQVIKYLTEDSIDEETCIADLFEFINSSEVLSITDFSKYCLASGYWSFYRRSYSIWFTIISEHNNKYF